MNTQKRGIDSFGRDPEAIPDFAEMSAGDIMQSSEEGVTVAVAADELELAGVGTMLFQDQYDM